MCSKKYGNFLYFNLKNYKCVVSYIVSTTNQLYKIRFSLMKRIITCTIEVEVDIDEVNENYDCIEDYLNDCEFIVNAPKNGESQFSETKNNICVQAVDYDV